MDLDHLKRFYEVVVKGSVSAAAESLHISQSALSRTIHILEEQIGVKLLIRHATGVSATQEGEKLFEFANRIVQEAKIVVKVLRDSPHEVQGNITISATPYLGWEWLMKYIPSFLTQHPRLSMKLTGHYFGLENYDSDVIISPHMLSQSGFIHRQLTELQTKLYASPRYLCTHGIPYALEDLDNHSLIVFSETDLSPYRYLRWHLKFVGKNHLHHPPRFEVNSVTGMLKAVMVDLGIAPLPIDCTKGTDLIEVLPYHEGPTIPIYYIYSEKLKDSRRITALADYIEEQLKTNM